MLQWTKEMPKECCMMFCFCHICCGNIVCSEIMFKVFNIIIIIMSLHMYLMHMRLYNVIHVNEPHVSIVQLILSPIHTLHRVQQLVAMLVYNMVMLEKNSSSTKPLSVYIQTKGVHGYIHKRRMEHTCTCTYMNAHTCESISIRVL